MKLQRVAAAMPFAQLLGLAKRAEDDDETRRARRAEEDDDEDQDKKADRKSTRLNSSHPSSSYAVFCLKNKNAALTDTFTILKKSYSRFWSSNPTSLFMTRRAAIMSLPTSVLQSCTPTTAPSIFVAQTP